MKLGARIVLDIVLIFAVMSGWWHVALIVAIVGLIFFQLYIEAAIAGMVYDALFGIRSDHFFKQHIALIVSTALFIVTFLIRRSIRR